jgi:hypothetical protein
MEGMEFAAAGKIKLVDNTLYLKIDSYPSILKLPDIAGKWFEIKLDNLTTAFNSSAQIQTQLATMMKTYNTSISKYLSIYDLDVFKDNISRMPDQVVHGIRTNCYNVSLDKNATQEFFQKTLQVTGLSSATQSSTTSEIYDSIDMTMCYGREDGLAYRQTIEMTGNVSYSRIKSIIPSSKNKVSISLDSTMWDYNVPFSVEKPVGATDITKQIFKK